MVKLTFRCLLLGAAFFFGVLYGNNQADNSGGKTKSIENIQHLIQTEKIQDHSTPVKNMVREQESAEDTQSSNVYSAVGDTVSKAVTGLFRGGVTMVSTVIENLLADVSSKEASFFCTYSTMLSLGDIISEA